MYLFMRIGESEEMFFSACPEQTNGTPMLKEALGYSI
jgi:hypothetical protein